MSDEFLKKFRKEPRPEFADALHKRLMRHPAADLPRLNHSPNGRKDVKEQEDKDMNASTGLRIWPERKNFRLEGRLVGLVAAIAALVLGLAIFNALYNPNVSGGLVGHLSAESATAMFERYINEVWNAGKTDLLPELLSADHTCYDPGKPKIVGVEPMEALVKTYRTAFPDWKFAIKDIVAKEDAVWARLVGTGTQTGPFAYAQGVTIDANGGPVTLEMVIIANFANGKIAEQRLHYDTFGLLNQLKAVTSPETYLTEQRNIAQLRGMIEDVDNQHKLDKLDLYVAEDGFLWHSGGRAPSGILTTNFLNTWYKTEVFWAFPDVKATITSIAASGDLVFAHVSYKGMFERSFIDPTTDILLQPTHKEYTWTMLRIDRFADGKIVETWMYSDPTYKD